MQDSEQTRIAQTLSVCLHATVDADATSWLVRIHPSDGIGELVNIKDDRLLIGRERSCGLMLDDDSVSRRHALLERNGEEYLLTDLGSTNGTFVNDERIQSKLLAGGDRLRFGNQIFKLLTSDRLEAQYYETVYKIMTTDGLTQAYNRRYLLDALERELIRARRNDRPLAVLMIDIDHFKEINDEHGHLAGDEVLQELCRRMNGILRADDVLARYGGEEFVVVLADSTEDHALQAAERIREAVAGSLFPADAARIAVTISIGLAMMHHDVTAVGLLAEADLNLYAAKREGRNRVVG